MMSDRLSQILDAEHMLSRCDVCEQDVKLPSEGKGRQTRSLPVTSGRRLTWGTAVTRCGKSQKKLECHKFSCHRFTPGSTHVGNRKQVLRHVSQEPKARGGK